MSRQQIEAHFEACFRILRKNLFDKYKAVFGAESLESDFAYVLVSFVNAYYEELTGKPWVKPS